MPMIMIYKSPLFSLIIYLTIGQVNPRRSRDDIDPAQGRNMRPRTTVNQGSSSNSKNELENAIHEPWEAIYEKYKNSPENHPKIESYPLGPSTVNELYQQQGLSTNALEGPPYSEYAGYSEPHFSTNPDERQTYSEYPGNTEPGFSTNLDERQTYFEYPGYSEPGFRSNSDETYSEYHGYSQPGSNTNLVEGQAYSPYPAYYPQGYRENPFKRPSTSEYQRYAGPSFSTNSDAETSFNKNLMEGQPYSEYPAYSQPGLSTNPIEGQPYFEYPGYSQPGSSTNPVWQTSYDQYQEYLQPDLHWGSVGMSPKAHYQQVYQNPEEEFDEGEDQDWKMFSDLLIDSPDITRHTNEIPETTEKHNSSGKHRFIRVEGPVKTIRQKCEECNRKNIERLRKLREIGKESKNKNKYSVIRVVTMCDTCTKFLCPNCHMDIHGLESPPETPMENEQFYADKDQICIHCKTNLGRGANDLIKHTKRCDVNPNRDKAHAYGCYGCKYATSQKTAMVVHIRQHTGDEPYCCQECSFSSKYRSNLLRHIQAHKKWNNSLLKIKGKSPLDPNN